ncbi:MAG: ECF-type sigma factor [Phycisphaerales bacterium JB039]
MVSQPNQHIRPDGADADFAHLYEQFRSTARRYFQRQPQDHTLQPTALVNEVFIRLAQASREAKDREHLAAIGATAMRQLLVDHARRRVARRRSEAEARAQARRGGDAPEPEDILALDEALERLRAADEDAARLVELRIFCGLGLADSAEALGVARSTASERWRTARAWLAAEMDPT